MIFDDQRAARERKREFRVALHTARTEASAGRGRGAAFQARLEQTEVAGLKVNILFQPYNLHILRAYFACQREADHRSLRMDFHVLPDLLS